MTAFSIIEFFQLAVASLLVVRDSVVKGFAGAGSSRRNSALSLWDDKVWFNTLE